MELSSQSSEIDYDLPLSKRITFSRVASILQHVHEATTAKARKQRFLKLITEWRASLAERLAKSAVPLCDDDRFFNVMRLCLPHLDLARPAYHLKENRLSRLIAEVLNISKGTDLDKELSSASKDKLPDAVNSVLRQLFFNSATSRKITVYRVNQLLDAMSRFQPDQDIKCEFRNILAGSPPEAVAWLVRIILRDVPLSPTEIFELYHPEALIMYRHQSDVEHICTMLADQNKSFLSTGELHKLRPFVWCHSMLSARTNIADVDRLLCGTDFFIETKYDGDRFQLHKVGSKFKYFSRNGISKYSSKFGESYESGTLTPSLVEAFSSEVPDLILDGEMMYFDTTANDFVPKAQSDGDVKSSKKFRDWDAEHPAGVEDCFVVFDVLYAKGQTLVDLPLYKRLEILEKIVRPVPRKLMFAERSASTQNTLAVAEALQVAMNHGDEGLIVKKAESTYQPDVRNGGGWFKVKPDYSDELVDSLDLLVMGADFGTGRDSKIFHSFTCGVRHVSSDGGERYLEVTKVGIGFSNDKLRDLNLRLIKIANKTKQDPPPRNMTFASCPEFWFWPKSAPVFQAKGTEIQASKNHPLGRNLRFPRFRGERSPDERDYRNCMTSDEFMEFKIGPLGKPNWTVEQIAVASDGLPSSKRRKAIKTGRGKVVTVSGALDIAERIRLEEIVASAVDSPLAGKEVSIINMPDRRRSEILEGLAKLGATSSVMPRDGKTHFIIAYKKDIYVQNYSKQNQWDVLTGEWFDRCLAANAFLEPRSLSDFFHATSVTCRIIADKFGNTFTGQESVDKLKACVTCMKAEGHIQKRDSVSRDEIAIFMEEDIGCHSKYHLFSRLVAYFGESTNKFKSRVQFYFSLYGGRIADSLNEPGVTHFIVDARNFNDEDWFAIALSKHAHLVNLKWVDDCIRDGTLHEDRLYRPT